MRAIFAISLFLTACADNPAPMPEDPVTVVYPCSVQDPVCAAAYEIATARCDHRYQCDDLYDVDYDQCVAWEMEDACARYSASGQGACWDASYDGRSQVDECVATYRATACDQAIAGCNL